MSKKKVLFICVHNSGRSRMAEAFLNAECEDFYEAQSAGLEPGTFNPLVAETMDELGLDIRQKPSQAVFDVWRSGPVFSHVISVCSESEAGGCPIFPGPTKRLHWTFPDPSKVEGDHEQKLAQVREIRDTIRARIKEWCQENCR
ncbi:MAG: arsenate reductase ArsC [Chthoniobacterales bacterium]|nr:arsenate reductase ArsC [Chthoniobacterales bacterium]